MQTNTKTWNITATTLTPLHIGSGRELQFNADYLYFGQQKTIGIVDPEKILRLIGPENVNTWVTYINQRKGIDEYVYNILKNRPAPEAFSSRLIPVRGTPLNQQNVKEQLHNGTGQPYIPGSSIKGALRTALLAVLIAENPNFVKDSHNLLNFKGNGYQDKQINKHYLGHDPNHDIGRLLRTSDMHFGQTECNLVKTVNQTGSSWQIKHQINQYVECIPTDQTAQGTLSIFDYDHLAENLIHNNREILYHPQFFDVIHQHTGRWLNNEIAFWDDHNMPAFAEPYYQCLQRLYRKFETCSESEIMLRTGFGGGFASMTGDWQPDQMTDTDYRQFTG